MANEPETPTQSETVTAPLETEAVAQPTQSVTAPSTRKRGRPRGASSLTPSGVRGKGKSKTAAKVKATPAPVKASMLNRVINFAVVVAVFVTAMSIQRIIPTEHIPEPKVETLAAPMPTTPAAPEVTATTAPVAAPEAVSAPAATLSAAPATAPTAIAEAAPAAALPTPPDCIPPKVEASLAKKSPVAKNRTTAKRSPAKTPADTQNQLNAGGAQDLDNEAARQAYKAASATRSNAPAPANR